MLRPLRLIISLVAVLWPSTVFAQAAPAGSAARGSLPGPEASIAVSLGVPTGTPFRDVYGGVLMPVALQLEWPLGHRGLLVFGGVRHVGRGGEALADGQVNAPGQRVRFRMTTARVGAGWQLASGAWKLAVAGGPTYNFFREEWDGFDLVTEDNAVGFLGQASVSRAISRRLSILVRTEYSWARSPSPQDDMLPAVGLGGIDIGGGVAVRF